MEARIRRHQDILTCSGYAVILFGAWSIVRMIMIKILDPLELDSLVESAGEADDLFRAVVFAVIIIMLAVDLLFRLYIGRSAIKEGSGEKKKLTYVILAAAYAAASIWSDVSYLIRSLAGSTSLEMVGSVIVDLTSCIALLEIVISSLSLRKLGHSQTV